MLFINCSLIFLQPHVIVTQKVLTPKAATSRKSPISGWAGGDNLEKDSTESNGMAPDAALHDNSQEGEAAGDENVGVNGEMNGKQETLEAPAENNNSQSEVKEGGVLDSSKEIDENTMSAAKNSGKDNGTGKVDNVENTDENTNENTEGEKGNTEEGTSVQKEELSSVVSDKDKIDIKTEDYL